MEDIVKNLEALQHEMPDPFSIKADVNRFCQSTAAEELIGGGQPVVNKILTYLSAKPEPALVVPAVLLLSCLDPNTFYDVLLNILKNAGRPVAEAFEHGFWLIKKEEEELADDLIDIVADNPAVLLLLQRPMVKKFKAKLQQWIEDDAMPLSLYAMYCYRYAMTKEDIPFLSKLSSQGYLPQIKTLAGEYLQKLSAS